MWSNLDRSLSLTIGLHILLTGNSERYCICQSLWTIIRYTVLSSTKSYWCKNLATLHSARSPTSWLPHTGQWDARAWCTGYWGPRGWGIVLATEDLGVDVLTTEDLGADVGGAAALVSQQIALAHQALAQAEVCDGDTPSPVIQHDVAKLQITVNDIALQIQTVPATHTHSNRHTYRQNPLHVRTVAAIVSTSHDCLLVITKSY